MCREALNIYHIALPGEPSVLPSLNRLALLLLARNNVVEAELIAREAVEISRKKLPVGDVKKSQPA